MRHPSLRSSMRASLFHSLQTFSRFTFAKGPTHRVCTLFPRGGIPLDPTFAAYVSIPDFSSHLPSSLSSFSFFLSFFFFSPRTKKNIPLFRFVLVLSSADVSRYYPRVAFPFSSIREDHANGLIYSLDTEEEEGKKSWEKVFNASPFFFFFSYHLYS